MTHPNLTEDECSLLTHVTMWGSDGYPIRKVGRQWTWGPYRSIQGPPVLFKTKREAVESFELYESILLDKKAGRI